MFNEMWQGNFQDDEEYREKFIELTRKLTDVASDFCVNALQAFSRVKGVPLNPLQIEQTIDFEIQGFLHQIQIPELLDVVRKHARLKFKGLDPFK